MAEMSTNVHEPELVRRRPEFCEAVTAFLEKRRADSVSAASTIGEPAA